MTTLLLTYELHYHNYPKLSDRWVMANSVDPDQTAYGLHCLPFCLHLLDALLYGKTALLHSRLKPLSNQLKAVFKQLTPGSNHGIHMLFEHGFCRLFTWRQTTVQVCPGINIFSWYLLTSTSFHSSWNDVKQNKKQNGVSWCAQCIQSDFFAIFQASSTGVFMELYTLQE